MTDFNYTSLTRARKPHRCGECDRMIRPSETYWRTAAVCEAEFFDFISCDHCHRARSLVASRGDGMWYYGGQEATGEWEVVAEDEADPAWRAYLWRLVAAHKRKWTRRDGALMTFPLHPQEVRGD